MKLSIIIPCYNSAATIANQLEALGRQRWSYPWEIIVVDNDSTDETPAILQQYQRKLPHLRWVIARERQGAAYARNVGVKEALSDALAFCDADDEAAPGWVAAMGEALQQYDCVAGRLEAEKLNAPDILKRRQCPQENGLQEYQYPPFLPHAATSNLGVKKSVHQTVGCFDESLLRLSDTDYCWRLQLAGFEIHFIPEALIHYRFRMSARDTYHQAYLWGMYNVFLYKKYRPLGMPPLTLADSLEGWSSVIRRLPGSLIQRKHERLMWVLAWRLGRLNGSIRWRVLAL